MTIFLEIDPKFQESSDLPNFRQIVITVFNLEGITKDIDLTIALVDDDHIQELNRDYLSKDLPTDVLAFPAGHTDPDTGHLNYGDVIISYPRAFEQAYSAGHPVSSELSLLTVHGVLHLLGFDHDRPEEKNKMWEAQSKILDRLGITIKSTYYSNSAK